MRINIHYQEQKDMVQQLHNHNKDRLALHYLKIRVLSLMQHQLVILLLDHN